MISVDEYMEKKNKILDEYERRVRNWLKKTGENEIADKIPFYRDGVVCPEVWFKKGNDFRPLFILKEVSIGKNSISDLDDYLKTWGSQNSFEFVENPFDDVKIGIFLTWRRIAALAKGLEEVQKGSGIREYNIDEFNYKEGGEAYEGDIEGYHSYKARTANIVYNDIINKIAVLEIKKIGGGTTAGSELSKATKYYSYHIKPFQDLICKQIELINPTVIIVCCKEQCAVDLLKEIENKTSDKLWVYGYHPMMNSIENFYYKTLETFKKNI